jgi:hypothetical protein
MTLKFLKALALLTVFFITVSFNSPRHYFKRIPLSEREVRVKIVYKVSVDGYLRSMRLKMIIPDDIADRQTINKMSWSIEPDSIYKINSNTYALFKFYDIDKSFKIVMNSHITIYRIINESNTEKQADLSNFLIAEPAIETESQSIISAAASLKQKTDIETVMKTYEFVQDHVKYKLNPPIGAEKVLESGVGKCMDFSDLFVALLRANKIPAKSVFGIVVDYVGENPLHAWSEVYLKKQGWVRFDATTGATDIKRNGDNYTMKISNRYVTLSEGRNDPELHVHQYHYSYFCNPGSEIKVKMAFDIVGQ